MLWKEKSIVEKKEVNGMTHRGAQRKNTVYTLPVDAIICKPQKLLYTIKHREGLKSQIVLITASQSVSVAVVQHLYISIVWRFIFWLKLKDVFQLTVSQLSWNKTKFN